jgi:hypothetical protein
MRRGGNAINRLVVLIVVVVWSTEIMGRQGGAAFPRQEGWPLPRRVAVENAGERPPRALSAVRSAAGYIQR